MIKMVRRMREMGLGLRVKIRKSVCLPNDELLTVK